MLLCLKKIIIFYLSLKICFCKIKDADNMRKTALHEDLHTYSLDYDRHVQEKIEEHKRQTKPPV